MPALRRFLFFFSFLVFLGLQSGWTQEEIFRQKYDTGVFGDSFVLVESVFGKVARHGALPYRITIRNNSGKARGWDVVLREGNPGRSLTTESTYRIEVENGTEAQREVTFQFAPAFLGYDYRNLSVSVSSPGLPSETRSHGEQTNQTFPALAMSEPLARRNLARLDAIVKKENAADPFFAKSVETSYLPTDWKGYSGLEGFLIDLKSWQSLSLAQKQAILAWIRLGGQLDVYTETDIPLSDLKLPVDITESSIDTAALSLGKVRIQKWDGRELPDNLTNQYRSLASRAETFSTEFESDWNLHKTFGTKPFNPALVFALLLIFAIVVAPVNLFYLAKPGRRHRLFITTPVISVGTCLLIIILILFIDGVGGRGIRVVLADLQPSREEIRLYLIQEQISRTGVMVNTGFQCDRDFIISPVRLAASDFNPALTGNGRNTIFEINGGNFGGGFFRSRSEQAFSIRSAETTRSRIERTSPAGEAAPPTLVSNLSQSISNLVYVDENGELWMSPEGPGIRPGGIIPLEKTDNNFTPEWLGTGTSLFSRSMRDNIQTLRSERNRFFARLEDGEALALPTHPLISWEKTTIILTGTPVASSSIAAPSGTSPLAPPSDTNE